MGPGVYVVGTDISGEDAQALIVAQKAVPVAGVIEEVKVREDDPAQAITTRAKTPKAKPAKKQWTKKAKK